MEAGLLLLAAGFAALRVTAHRHERNGLTQYRQSGDVLRLRNNVLWRFLKGVSDWGLLLAALLFLQFSLRA